jgi:cyclin-dependent kinase regulatory subunit CKS1
MYSDDNYEYFHLTLNRRYAAAHIPQNRLFSNDELRAMKVIVKPHWEHYCVYRPEPHIMLFRRPKTKK